MSRIPSLSAASPSPAPNSSTNDLRNVDVTQFLNLLIAELQNQDPLNPMENSEMIQQISQIREISATNQLSDTLSSVLLGQNLSTASGLIGKRVDALADDRTNIQGIVDRVTIENDQNDETKQTIRVHVGDKKIDVKNIRAIQENVQAVT